MSCEQIDCPICFECIGATNNITTECGHKFHASCLMTNVTRNGFGCPCCRTRMAELPDEEEEDDDETLVDDDSDDDSDDDTELDYTFSDNEDALRGLRLFTNLLEGVEHNQEDLVAEFQYLEQREEDIRPCPTLEVVAAALREQGVTYENLLASALMEHEEYENTMHELDRGTNDLWGKLRMFISNYRPAPTAVAEDTVAVAEDPIAVAEDTVAVAEEDDWIKELASICCPEPTILGEEFDFSEEFNFFIEERRGLTLSLDDVRMDLSKYMDEVDYRAQPKMPLIHV